MNSRRCFLNRLALAVLPLPAAACGADDTVIAEEHAVASGRDAGGPGHQDSGNRIPPRPDGATTACSGIHGNVGSISISHETGLWNGGVGWNTDGFTLAGSTSDLGNGEVFAAFVNSVHGGGSLFLDSRTTSSQYCVASLSNIAFDSQFRVTLGGFSQMDFCPGEPLAGELTGCSQQFAFPGDDAGASEPGYAACAGTKLVLRGTVGGQPLSIDEQLIASDINRAGRSLDWAFTERGGVLRRVSGPTSSAARLTIPGTQGETLCVGDITVTPDASGDRQLLVLRDLSRLESRCGETPTMGSVTFCQP